MGQLFEKAKTNEMNKAEYQQYGPEWEAELMRWTKKDLIQFMKRAFIANENEKEQYAKEQAIEFFNDGFMKFAMTDDGKWYDPGTHKVFTTSEIYDQFKQEGGNQ